MQLRVHALRTSRPFPKALKLTATANRPLVWAVASACLVALIVGLMLGSAASHQAKRNAEERASADAAHVAHIFYYSVWAPIREQVGDVSFREAADPRIMSVFARRSTFGLSIVELSAWSLEGELLWASDVNRHTSPLPEGWSEAVAGSTTSHHSTIASLTDLSGRAYSGDVVRTLIPFYDAPGDGTAKGNLVGVIEVARDVSGELASGGFVAVWLPSLIAALAVLAVWGTAWLYLHGGNPRMASLLRQQSKRIENLELQRAQTAKLATVGETVAGVAHEINNPLTTIWGLSQLALAKDLDETTHREMQMIHDEAQRTAKIVQNLLSFARARESEMAYTSVNAAVNAAVELRHYQLQVNNIGIAVETDPNLPRTMADPHKIQQVVLNLITNAEQAIRGFRSSGQIVVRTQTDGARIRLSIEDDGPGIPENVRNKIFSPFFTTKEEGQGTGLGLSICLGIVQEHGGTIVAESLPNGGTAMVVELPITNDSAAVRNEALASR